MPNQRKISPAKKPFNPTYEDMEAAVRSGIAPVLRELQELKAIQKQPKALSFPQIKQSYGFSRHDVIKFEKEGRLTRLGKGRPKFSSVELDQIILAPRYQTKMSAV